MPELRSDWLTGRTVIVAEERAARPNDFGEASFGEVASATGHQAASAIPLIPVTSPACPFCPGQEHRTPPAVYEQADGENCWRVRVVPNLFPAVTFSEVLPPPAGSISPAVGAHEVVIESPRHLDRTSALAVTDLRDVMEVYTQRLRHWADDGRLQYGLVFKNQGLRAGASLTHLHSQLVALPTVPSAVEAELHRAEQDFAAHRSCPYCRLIQQERASGERIVVERDGFVAFCPHASVQPYETWLMPVEHQPAFERPTDPRARDRLADVLHELIGRVEAIVPDAAYNFILRTAPWLPGIDPWCHWRIELLPRVATFAGLEFATGIHINPLSPERAAQHLRSNSLFLEQ